MYRNDVLVVEISGKRPGTEKNRPTEYMDVEFDHLIISNNSDGYETKWEIVNVPESYRSWYIENVKNSENAWYAPMNRSYAIKYAREKGYKYLVQLDDNIKSIRIAYSFKNSGKKYDCTKTSKKSGKMINDIIDMLVTVLENTNAGMSGCNMMGAGMPGSNYLAERYCYSLFALDLSVVPDCFHGDFEDDVEYRIRLSEMGIPCVQVCCLLYGKTAQGGTKDLSGISSNQ